MVETRPTCKGADVHSQSLLIDLRSCENLISLREKIAKDADQPVHSRSLISALIIH